jgi:tetratricopeptide (TPR) repeat protein
MVKKKKPQIIETSIEEVGQAQYIADRYRQIAKSLHASKDQSEVEAALTEVNLLSENAQMALLKDLSKIHETDAADILTALYEVSPLKNVRKEARRSLIRLEGVKIYPVWEPPIDRAPAITVGTHDVVQLTDGPRRFWKGMVTDSRDVGEVQLLLCWEQGESFREVLVLGLLLDFTFDGVKDAFIQTTGRSGFERLANRVAENMPGLLMKDCSLAEGRRTLLDALAVNKKSGILPGKDYRDIQPLVEELVLNTPDVNDEGLISRDRSGIAMNIHGLTAPQVVTSFVELCFDGRHDIAYDLLAQHSRLREGLSKELWVERRKDWLYQAGPKELVPVFLYESEPVKSKLWLPQVVKGKAASEKEVEAAWSAELYETPLNHALPEIPEASAVYEVSQRRWYWASYTLVQEKSEWRIQSMTDEVTKTQGLSIKELEAKINEVYEYSRNVMNLYNAQLRDGEKESGELENLLENAGTYGVHITYYIDALIKKNPLDPQPYENGALQMRSFGDYERCLVYLSLLAERFPETRAFTLWRIGEMQRLFSEKLREEDEEKRAEQYEEYAEETLKEALSLENSLDAHISLVEMYVQKSERMDDAEVHLLQAKELATEPEDKSHIERHLADVAESRDQFHEALVHYQNAVDYSPKSAYNWKCLGDSQNKLEDFDDAESSYKRAIELEPEDDEYYIGLCNFYMDNGQSEKAIALLEDGLEEIPDSALLHAMLASMYLVKQDYREAEIYLERAENLDPDLELIPMLRLILAQQKAKPVVTHKLGRSVKHKKRH